MMSDNLIPKIKDDEWFANLIERRLEENKNCENESYRRMNEAVLESAIDFRLKYLNSMKSDSRKDMIKRIMEICKQNGFIPQYESSGAPAFNANEVKLSPDGKFVACLNAHNVILLPAKELPLTWIKVTHPERMAWKTNVSFSPDLSKIAILYRVYNRNQDNEQYTDLQIWDIAEIKILKSEKVFHQSNAISWSADGNRIAYQKQENEICIYDFSDGKEILSIQQSASAICLDDSGTEILLLDWDIKIINIESQEEKFKEKAPISLHNPEPLFKNGYFYVLTDGEVLKIKEKMERIELDDVISPEYFDVRRRSLKNFHLKIENENVIMYDHFSEYILSDTLEVKKIRKDSYVPINQNKVRQEQEKRISAREEIKIGQTTYITYSNLIIGFEIAEEKETYVKYNYRKYIFDSLPENFWDKLVIHESIKQYEKVSADNLDGEFQAFRDSFSDVERAPFKKGEVYLRQTGEAVLIKDTSLFIDLFSIRSSFIKKIESDDPSNEYYLDEKDNLYCVNPSSRNVEKIADNASSSDFQLDKITRISGSSWPKIYIIEKESLGFGKCQLTIFIQSAPMQKIAPMTGVCPSHSHNVCIFSGKIYW